MFLLLLCLGLGFSFLSCCRNDLFRYYQSRISYTRWTSKSSSGLRLFRLVSFLLLYPSSCSWARQRTRFGGGLLDKQILAKFLLRPEHVPTSTPATALSSSSVCFLFLPRLPFGMGKSSEIYRGKNSDEDRTHILNAQSSISGMRYGVVQAATIGSLRTRSP